MNKCPVTLLKTHSLGDTFAPLLIDGRWQLRNGAGDCLIGYRGNAYKFKSQENAKTWLCSNLARFDNAEEPTSSVHMAKLSKIYSYTQEQFIINEIEAIQSYERGEWTIKPCAGQIEYIEVPADVDYDGGNAYGIVE